MASQEANTMLERVDKLDERSIQDERAMTNILIVDDEPIMRDLLTDVLKTESYAVSSLPRAEDALERISKGNGIEIIITDIKMKGMNGLELLKKVKEINSNIDVIVMTGYASIQTAVESMKLGAVDYLTKPLNIDQIRLIVNKTTEQRILKRKANESSFYKKLSRIDGMTELFNHRFFQQLLKAEIARSERDNSPVSLIIIDIDNFKVLNDKSGHPMGDLALKKLSWLLTKNCRQCDFVARYGGEEFAIILPGSNKKTAQLMAKRLRKLVEMTEFEKENILPQGKFTISLGVAEYPTDAKTREELIEKADQALYKAKSNGKNRVEVYNPN
jgi:diguanylate cyclase (GGDEF)-like protein